MKRAVSLCCSLAAAALTAAAADPAVVLPASLHNYTVRLTLRALRVAPEYGGERAPDGRQFYVFTVTWEDVIDPAFAKERDLPVSAKDDNLSDSLALVVDDHVVVPVLAHEANTAGLDPNDPDLVSHSGGSTDAAYLRKVVGVKDAGGKRSQVYYALDQPGAQAVGEILFAVPTAPWHRLELRYHDPIGGDGGVLLAGPAGPAAAAEPAAGDPPGTQTNEVFALAARLDQDPAVGPAAPPPGRRYIAVDFQGRSLLKVEDQCPPYDPTHPPGATFWRPDPAGWGDFSDELQCVADGRFPGVLDKASDVFDSVQFVPGVWTHHRLVFLVPAAARTLDLTCFFNDYEIPGHDDKVTPRPMRFHLAGPVAAPFSPPAGAEQHIVDGPVVDDVLRHAVVAQFGGLAAAPDERFLVVDFAVRNTGTEEAEFHAAEQLVWFNEGDEVPPDDATDRGPLAPPPYLKLAPGDARAFQAVWRIPARLKQAQLGLKGNEAAERFTLPLPAN